MTAELGVDPDRIALVGFSAGGHLVLLAGYAPREFSPSCDVAPVRPSTVVALTAPTELAPLYELDSWRYPDFVGFAEESKMFLPGGTPATNPEGYTAASPLTHVRRDVPPTPIIHGSRDQIVPVAQARGLEAALREPARDIVTSSFPTPITGSTWCGAAPTPRRPAPCSSTSSVSIEPCPALRCRSSCGSTVRRTARIPFRGGCGAEPHGRLPPIPSRPSRSRRDPKPAHPA